MSATTNISVRVDADLKRDAEALFGELGLTMSEAITILLRAAVNQDGIPRAEPNAVTKAALAEYEEMTKNPGSYKRYHSVDELFDEVLRDV